MSQVSEFNDYRSRMNERILAQDNKVLKRFFSLDNQAYQDGALTEKTKELLGLVASMVLRCDDWMKYMKYFLLPIWLVDLFVYLIPVGRWNIGTNCLLKLLINLHRIDS